MYSAPKFGRDWEHMDPGPLEAVQPEPAPHQSRYSMLLDDELTTEQKYIFDLLPAAKNLNRVFSVPFTL